jgi:hypothetical protein
MRKFYNFILEPQPNKNVTFDLDKNPYSSHHINPKTWAKILLHVHPEAQKVLYKAENGRKVYEMVQGQS